MEWHDLLGTPWRLHESRPGVGGGMDCSTLAETVLRRLGGEPPSTNPFRQRESEGVRNEMGSYFAYLDAAYERLGDSISCATRRGDLVRVTKKG